MPEDFTQDQRYQIVIGLHKIEKLLQELPDTIADAVEKALTEAFGKEDKFEDRDEEDSDAS